MKVDGEVEQLSGNEEVCSGFHKIRNEFLYCRGDVLDVNWGI